MGLQQQAYSWGKDADVQRIRQAVEPRQEGEKAVLTLNHLVHCHICPLKDFCSSGNPDASWRIQHEGQPIRRGEKTVTVRLLDADYEHINKASANCPLRRAVAYTDTVLSQELLKRIER